MQEGLDSIVLWENGMTEGVCVAFTDGYISVPSSKPSLLKDCLWVIGEHDTDPTGGRWGEVLRVNDDGNVAQSSSDSGNYR